MSRRLDIGVASYLNPKKLEATLLSIEKQSVTDWRCFIVHNPAVSQEEDFETRTVIAAAEKRNARFVAVWGDVNGGYAGAVNELLSRTAVDPAATPYVAYCDNDIEILTLGWDEKLCEVLDKYPEVGQVFPGSGHYGFFNGGYDECLWSAGFCWMLRRAALDKLKAADTSHYRVGKKDRGRLDTSLGHHEEVDLMIRLRLAGFQIGCRPDVNVKHHETATQANAADHQPGGRIHDGVVRWMNKWNGYFCGDQLAYSMTTYDPRALRYTDWPPCALYLERMTLARFPEWNGSPRVVSVPGAGEMDAVEVLKPKGCYRGRAI
jgi:GT2 family glycosyltransferase